MIMQQIQNHTGLIEDDQDIRTVKYWSESQNLKSLFFLSFLQFIFAKLIWHRYRNMNQSYYRISVFGPPSDNAAFYFSCTTLLKVRTCIVESLNQPW